MDRPRRIILDTKQDKREFSGGTDYRGEYVIASMREVPGTSWVMAVKIDASEVFDPVKERFWNMVLIILVFISAAGAGVGLIWRRRSESFYREQYESAEELRMSEEKFSRAFQSASYAMTISEPDSGLLLDVNEAFSSITGYSYNEAVGRTALDLHIWYNPDDRIFIMNQLEAGNSIRGEEFRFRRKNGEIFTGLYSAEMISTAKGPLVISSTNDITEQKKNEESLRKSEERYRLLAENISDVIWLLDLNEGCYKFVSPSVKNIRGYTADEVMSMSMAQSLTPGSLSYIEKILPERLEEFMKGIILSYTDRIEQPCSDGSTVWTETKTGFIINRDNGHIEVYGVSRDITEKLLAEEKLRESEEKFRSMVENAPDPIFIQTEGRFRYVNKAAVKLFGAVNENEVLGRMVIEHNHPDFREMVYKRIYTLNVERKPVSQLMETRFIRLDGSEVWVETAGVPIVYDGMNGALVFVRNIHERKLAEEKVRQGDERYRLTLENMIEGAQIIGFDWRYIYINKAAEIQNRRSKEELLGRVYMEMWPGIETTEVYNMISRCMDERIVLRMENRFVFPDGNEGWFDLSMQPVPEGVFILSIDITERKNAEEKLVKAYDRLSRMTSSNVVGVIIADSSGRLLEVNDYYLDMLGYTREDFDAGHIRWDTLTPPEFLWLDSFAIEELHIYGKCTPYQKQYFRKDGSRMWVLLADVLLTGAEDEIFAIALDITERKEAEFALLQNEEKYRSLIENAPDAIFINFDGKVVFVNKACLRLFGASGSEELIGKDIYEIFHKEYHSLIWERVQQLLASGVPVEPLEEKIIRLDGKAVDVEVSAAPFNYNGTNAIHVILRDITERKRLQTQIEETLAGLEQTVTERTGALEKANRELEAFSYSISHDLRAPLRHISGFIQMLKSELAGLMNEKSIHYMDVIEKSAGRMGQLIDDLLSFSRMGRAALSTQIVDMGSIVDDVIDEYSDEINTKGIAVIKHILPVVQGDRAMLRVVVTNLISNAVKFSSRHETPMVEIGSKMENGYHVFYVRDNGDGFDMNYSDKLFRVFSRLHSENDYEGTGIGLATVKGIIERHKGTVWAEGEKGRGASFYFSLPVLEPEKKKK